MRHLLFVLLACTLTLAQSHNLARVDARKAEQEAANAKFVYHEVQPNAANAPTPKPELACRRLRLPADPAIYLIDPEGFRHWIPDPYTYNRLFRDWDGVFYDADLFEISDAGPLSHGATLIRADGTSPVYFVSNKSKRWVTSPAVMDKCNFKWPIDGDLVAPAVTEAIPDGSPWNVK